MNEYAEERSEGVAPKPPVAEAMTLEEFGALRIPRLLNRQHQAAALEWLGRLELMGRDIPQSYGPEFECRTDEDGVCHTALRKARRLFWNDPGFWGDFLVRSGIEGCARAMLTKPALIFHAAFLKLRRVGSAVGFHQDQALWPRPFPGAVSIWVALDEADEQNGCLLGVPGSHRAGLLPHVKTESHPWHPVVPLSELKLEAPRPVSIAAGDAVAWHRYFVHGSGPNLSERDRRGMVMVFAPAGHRGLVAPDVHYI